MTAPYHGNIPDTTTDKSGNKHGAISMQNSTWLTAGLTDRGLKRKDNQDNFLISDDKRLLVVADGMGGASGGEKASKLAVGTIEAYWNEAPPDYTQPNQVEHWLKEAVARANAAVRSAALESRDSPNMGTTLVMAILSDEGHVHIAHVGDSRATHISNEEVVGLTTDHSVVMEMFKRGQLTKEQCRVSPFRSIITRCLGHDEQVAVDYCLKVLGPGDWLVLASDGLSEVVQEKELKETVNNLEMPEEACSTLLEMVLSRDAPDNVTILSARLVTSKQTDELPVPDVSQVNA
ncbi:MAG TPA: protein phosphatase 2C domain-containing protein [Candidatus Obscuribacter sp.]|nr:protein phosphatase 2C domain-containing protein [Candidatus Obscuribacter sp.]HNG75557.1 protein phosphatase 2C domain-containing protein [Candidatus Obscuribacter sp.]